MFNTILGWFDLGPLPWLQSAETAMPSIVIEATWQRPRDGDHLPCSAGGRPADLYDAADVDGASIWQKIRYVTLPQLRDVLFLTLILQLIATAQLFTEPFLFTSGGPANSTMTVLLLIYKYAFQNSLGGDYGMAAALSLMLAAPWCLHRGLLLATRRWSMDHDAAASASRAPAHGRGARILSSADRRQRRVRRTRAALVVTPASS